MPTTRPTRSRPCCQAGTWLAAGHGADDEIRLGADGDGPGQQGVGRVMGQGLLAGEETGERPPRAAVMVADGAAQYRVAGFQRVQDGPLRDRPGDVEPDLAVDAGERAQMGGQDDPDRKSVV